MSVDESFKVLVDYSKTLIEMIKLGRYNFVTDINDQRFLLQGAGQHEVELVLVHLMDQPTTNKGLVYLNEQVKPAKIEHLLSFGAKYPDIQREFRVIALGSSFVNDWGFRGYPFLYSGGGMRGLRLCWRHGTDAHAHWNDDCRFLAVRKEV